MKLVELRDITYNLDNKRIPLNSIERSKKESNPIYPYIGANNIMGYIDEYIFDEKILCIAEDGGSWGKNETCAKIYNEKVWVNNHAHVITARENLVLEYLMYYLNYADLNLYINGATRGKLTKSSLNSIQIPLPPLEQQKKIAAILDAADTYRQLTKALIAKYDELTQSLFLDMFGDPVKNEKGWGTDELNNLCRKISVGFVGTCEPYYCSQDVGVPMLRTGNLGEGFLRLNNLKYVTFDFHEKQKKSQLNSGDILIARHGDNGKAVLYNGEFEQANCLNIVVLRPNEKLNSMFIQFLLNNDSTRKKISGLTGGATQKVVNTKEIQQLIIPFPPTSIQNQFAERVQAIEVQKAQAQASLEKAEELFASLLQKAFKGELV